MPLAADPAPGPLVVHGLRQNWPQFSILALLTLLVGMTIGVERVALPRNLVYTYLRSVNQWVRWAREEGEAIQERARAPLPRVPRSLLDILLSRGEISSLVTMEG